MPMDVIPPWLMALKAYSGEKKEVDNFQRAGCRHSVIETTPKLTDLVQPSFGREDGDVSVESRAAASRHFN